MRLKILLAVIAMTASAFAEDAGIKVPMTPGVLPEPGPVSGAVDRLTSDTLYIVTAQKPLMVIQSPDGGNVNVTQVESPMSFFARFADGNGQFESRKYTEPCIYVITPVKQGKIELLFIPVGVDSVEQIVRQTLTVSGQGPNPPPDPGPRPDPEPQPEPTKSFRVIFIKESGRTLSAEQSAIPGAKAIRDYLDEKTTKDDGRTGWREYDPDQSVDSEPEVIRELWAAIKKETWNVPCMAVEVNGKVKIHPFPRNVQDALETLKKAGG